MRDAWNCDETYPGWSGLNTLTLRLMIAGFCSLATYGLWAMRDTLEGERSPSLKPFVPMTWWIRGSYVLSQAVEGSESELPPGKMWTGGNEDRLREVALLGGSRAALVHRVLAARRAEGVPLRHLWRVRGSRTGMPLFRG